MRSYEQAVRDAGFTAATSEDPTGGHEWLERAVTAVPDWFDQNP